MAFVKYYKNLYVGKSGAASVAPGSTLDANSTYISNGIPIEGAKYIIFRIRSATQTATFQTTSAIFVGEHGGRTNTATKTVTYLNPTSLGYTRVGTVDVSPVVDSNAANVTVSGGIAFALHATAGARMWHKFAQLSLVTNASVAPVDTYIDAEVVYDNDADVVMAEMGQSNYQVLTT